MEPERLGASSQTGEVMTGFMQAIEFTTSRFEEVEALVQARRGESEGTVIRGTITARLNRPGTYLTIIESDLPDAAQEHGSHRGATDLMAALAPLCDEPPRSYSLASASVPYPRQPDED
jgi:hypothetical protein